MSITHVNLDVSTAHFANNYAINYAYSAPIYILIMLNAVLIWQTFTNICKKASVTFYAPDAGKHATPLYATILPQLFLTCSLIAFIVDMSLYISP